MPWTGEAEGLAELASDESQLNDRPRCDPRTMAVSYCGLMLAPWPGARPRLVDGVIWYPSTATVDAQAYYVAHELGHDIISHAGWRLDPATEEAAASRIGCALLLPRRAYSRDLRSVGWDLPSLLTMWPLASAWVHARRIAELSRGIVASRWRRGRLVARTIAGAATSLERELASDAAGESSDGRSAAWRFGRDSIVMIDVA